MNKFSVLIKESLDIKYQDKLSDEYKNFKRIILQSIDKSLKEDNENKLKEFIDNIIDNKDITTLIDLVENSEIINLYLKFQDDIDEITRNENWYDKIPSDEGITGLNDFVIEGTKKSIIFILKEILKDIKN